MEPYYSDALTTIYHGECLAVMAELAPASFDAIICDPPYGTTACAWDSVIPFEPMWAQLKRLIKPRGAIVLFGSQPFTSALVMSNPGWFRYEWVWQKHCGSNFAVARRQPMKEHENILVFYTQQPTYNPQMQTRAASGLQRINYKYSDRKHLEHIAIVPDTARREQDRLPGSVQKVNRETGLHPTQKPLDLMEYLIKTYTNEGERVLDFTFGSGTTLRAAKNLKRHSVGIELLEQYCNAAVRRLAPTFEEPIRDATPVAALGPLFDL